jgi:hypothetical protein
MQLGEAKVGGRKSTLKKNSFFRTTSVLWMILMRCVESSKQRLRDGTSNCEMQEKQWGQRPWTVGAGQQTWIKAATKMKTKVRREKNQVLEAAIPLTALGVQSGRETVSEKTGWIVYWKLKSDVWDRILTILGSNLIA